VKYSVFENIEDNSGTLKFIKSEVYSGRREGRREK